MATCGETIHTFIERHSYHGIFLPGFTAMTAPDRMAYASGLDQLDSITLSAGRGESGQWLDLYENVLNFVNPGGGDVTKRTESGYPIRFSIEERDEDLDYLSGAGVSQIALSTTNLASTVSNMLSHGVEFHQTGRGTSREEVYVVTKPVEDRPSLSFVILEKNRR